MSSFFAFAFEYIIFGCSGACMKNFRAYITLLSIWIVDMNTEAIGDMYMIKPKITFATLLMTDIRDEIWWWQFCDIDDRFDLLSPKSLDYKRRLEVYIEYRNIIQIDYNLNEFYNHLKFAGFSKSATFVSSSKLHLMPFLTVPIQFVSKTRDAAAEQFFLLHVRLTDLEQILAILYSKSLSEIENMICWISDRIYTSLIFSKNNLRSFFWIITTINFEFFVWLWRDFKNRFTRQKISLRQPEILPLL